MKAVIIDDEKRSADNLRILLEENCPEIEIIGIYHDGQTGISQVKELAPDVLFLDIQMPFADGFMVRDAVFSVCPNVIFTTAFADYAIKAIRAEACDYLLKPIDPEELRNAVGKARLRIEENKRVEIPPNKFARIRPLKLPIQGVDGYSLVDYIDVIRLEASSNYTNIYCRNGKKHTVARLLKDFEELLTPEGFFRTHSSHLVNLAHVVRYLRGDGGYIFMSDGTQIEVSRSRKKELLRVLLGEE